jgi:hypothetical protein
MTRKTDQNRLFSDEDRKDTLAIVRMTSAEGQESQKIFGLSERFISVVPNLRVFLEPGRVSGTRRDDNITERDEKHPRQNILVREAT